MDVGLISHITAALAFVALSALLLISWKRGRLGAWLLLACGLTALWAMLESAQVFGGFVPPRILAISEVLRSAGWLTFLIFVLPVTPGIAVGASPRRWVAVSIGGLCGLLILGYLIGGTEVAAGQMDITIAGRLLLAIAGLLLVENLYRNTVPDRRWALKFLCFGVGGLFGYDFFLYSEALLYQRVNLELYEARGVINAFVVPLVAVSAARNPDWSIDVFVSRRAIFHTTTLLGAGLYLLLIAAAGYYLRRFGGDWGPIFQVAALFLAAMLLLLAVFSGRFRAYIKVKINKHFFTYRYDYREEWLRLINTISAVESNASLPVRVIQGIADIVESPEGALWIQEQRQVFSLVGAWNVSPWNLSPEEREIEADPAFSKFLEERGWIINLDEFATRADLYPGFELPAFIERNKRAWLIVPLLHHGHLLGFLVLGHPRAPKELNWEDYDLLKTGGRQSAGYLAEQRAANALAQARQFEEFNRRFAFVLHDIKNLVSQLSLMVGNADKHKNNPAFMEDMVETVKESVDKMNRLLVRLHESGKEARATSAVDLAALMRRVVEGAAEGARGPSFECRADGMAVVADEDRLTAVLAHLIDNALEATEETGGEVRLRLGAQGPNAVIDVEDDGVGMDPEFVRNELFKPFKSTKSGGYGIGAYESLQFVQELGGRLDVTSQPGAGTTVRITVPALRHGESSDRVGTMLVSKQEQA